jgi:hypothetical protein
MFINYKLKLNFLKLQRLIRAILLSINNDKSRYLMTNWQQLY